MESPVIRSASLFACCLMGNHVRFLLQRTENAATRHEARWHKVCCLVQFQI